MKKQKIENKNRKYYGQKVEIENKSSKIENEVENGK